MVHTRWFRMLVCLLVLFSLQGLRSCSRTADPSLTEGACPAVSLRWLTTQDAGERRLSRYDFLLKKYAARVGMDWRLLAAIVYHESKFDEQALSPMGAKGLMQLRDVAALHFERPDAQLFDPEENLDLGTMLLDELFEKFRREGVAEEDIVRFALASYNVGSGALARRRAEADSLGLDPNSWSAVATIFDREDHSTPAYIAAVEQTYQRYCQRY